MVEGEDKMSRVVKMCQVFKNLVESQRFTFSFWGWE